MKTFLSLLFIVFSLLGIADATYLTYEKLYGFTPPCGPGFNCAAVLESPYAYILGIPLSVFGIFYYLTIFIFAVLHFLEVDLQKIPFFRHRFFRNATPFDFLTLFTLFGVLFSGYLVFIMGFVIKAWCKYCLVSAATSTILFLLVQAYKHIYHKNASFFLKT